MNRIPGTILLLLTVCAIGSITLARADEASTPAPAAPTAAALSPDALRVGRMFSWDGAPVSSPRAGRLTVLLFATPDAESTPAAVAALREIVERKRDDGLAAALVVAHATPEQAGEIQRKYSLAFSVAADTRGAWSEDVSSGELPCLVAIRPNGKVAYISRGWEESRGGAWRTIIDRLLDVGARPTGRNGEPLPRARIEMLIGRDAPDVPVTSWINEPPQNLDGRYVLYSFWATTCSYSREMISLVENGRASFGGAFESVAISGEKPEVVSAFVSEGKYAQAIGVDTQHRTVRALHVSTTPYGFLRAPDGRVVWQGNPLTLLRGDAARLRAFVSPAPAIKPSE